MKPIKYFELDLRYNSKLDPSKLTLFCSSQFDIFSIDFQEIEGKQFLPNSL